MTAGPDRGSAPGRPEIEVTVLTPGHAAAAARWRYEGPWSRYDPREGERITAEGGYHAIVERRTGTFLGYVCLGAEARVPGLAEEPGVLDVGIGLDPAVVGRGRGRSIVGPVLAWIDARSGGAGLRAVVQSWNRRSLRLCEHLGFTVSGHHLAEQEGGHVDYAVLRRPAPDAGTGADA
jgi:ribosomal-protein-alanine N-acetyltransferase